MNSPIRERHRPLVHLISGLGSGGAENFLLKLLGADPQLQAASQVISIRPVDDLSPQFEALGVPVMRLPLGAHPAALINLFRLIRALAHPDVKLIQSWLYFSDTMAALVGRLLLKKPVIWGIRSSHAGSGKWMTSFLAQRLNPALSRQLASAIVCCGRKARESHAALGYAKHQLIVIPNGYDTAHVGRNAAAGARVRDELGVGSEEFLVGMAARVTIYKDHETLYRAIAIARTQIPCLRLLLCGNGTGPDTTKMAAHLARHGLMDIALPLGLRRDMNAIYSAIDLHILSSLTEGFPNVVAESVLCGCGSISTDVGDASEILHDTRWLVPPKMPELLAAKILEYYRLSPLERMTVLRENKAWVEDHFEMSRVAKQYCNLYRSIAPEALDPVE